MWQKHEQIITSAPHSRGDILLLWCIYICMHMCEQIHSISKSFWPNCHIFTDSFFTDPKTSLDFWGLRTKVKLQQTQMTMKTTCLLLYSKCFQTDFVESSQILSMADPKWPLHLEGVGQKVKIKADTSGIEKHLSAASWRRKIDCRNFTKKSPRSMRLWPHTHCDPPNRNHRGKHKSKLF